MCRLLGYASPKQRTVRSVLGGNQSVVFQDMTQLHKDGWGVAWVAGRIPHDLIVRKEKTPLTGAGDDRLTAALSGRRAQAQIVHLRMATDGMVSEPANTHPFLRDGLAFAHNGSLTPTSTLEEHIAPEIRDGLQGETDSERYFAVIRTKIAEGHELLPAVCLAVSELRPYFPDASMNAIILSPTTLIAIHASVGAPVPHDLFDASGMSEEELPQDHRTDYYLMRQRTLDDGTIMLASSGLDIVGWDPLPSESVTAVDLASLESETRLLGARPSARR